MLRPRGGRMVAAAAAAAGLGWRPATGLRESVAASGSPMTASPPARRSRRRRFLKWLFVWLPLIVVTGTSAQVIILRWLPPVTSSIMVGREVDALLAGDWTFRLHYHWREWNRISPNLP